jgi:hypothetical protein
VSELARRGLPLAAAPDPVLYRAPSFGWRDPASCASYDGVRCPTAERLVEELVTIPHIWLAGSARTVRRIAAGIRAALD